MRLGLNKMSVNFKELQHYIEIGEICEIRFIGRSCEVITQISSIVNYDVQSAVIELPNHGHIRISDIVSIVPITPGHP